MYMKILRNICIFTFCILIVLAISYLFATKFSYIDTKHNCALVGGPALNLIVGTLLVLSIGIVFFNKILQSWFYAVLLGFFIGGGLYTLFQILIKGCVYDYYRIGEIYFNITDIIVVFVLVFLITLTIWTKKES